MAPNAALVISSLALLAVIAVQDFLVPKLRNATISAGLTGRDHVLLDASYVPLSASLAWVMHGQSFIMFSLSAISAVALIAVAFTNTAWRFVDFETGGKHALWHSRFTVTVFISAFSLQIAGDLHRHALIPITALTFIAPAAAYAYFHFRKTNIDGTVIAASPAAEKLFVAFLCMWFVAFCI